MTWRKWRAVAPEPDPLLAAFFAERPEMCAFPMDIVGLAGWLGASCIGWPALDVSSCTIITPAATEIHFHAYLPTPRWRFEVAHQIGQIMLYADAASQEKQVLGRPHDGGPLDKRVNDYAAALLMPASWVTSKWWHDKIQHQEDLAAIFAVSSNVMAYRLKALGFPHYFRSV